MTRVSRLLDRLMAPMPAGRLAAVRTIVVGYAVVWTVIRTDYWRDSARLSDARWRPIGVVSWFGGPPSVTFVTALAVVAVVTGCVAAMGRAWRLSAPVFAVAFLYLTTFGASWQQIAHTEHLVVLHVLVLACGPSGRGPSATAGWTVRVMSLVTVATYVVAGAAKLRFGGGLDWLDGDRLLRLVGHDNLRKRLLGDPYSPIVTHVIEWTGLFTVAAVLAVVVELGAPLALIGRRVRYLWIGLAWAFHIGVLALMAVLFPYPLVGAAFASMLPVEGLAPTLRTAGRSGVLRRPRRDRAPGHALGLSGANQL
ncbi:hypothetical protein BH24ACT5_BH24ACT5_07910 [soil metagenome]